MRQYNIRTVSILTAFLIILTLCGTASAEQVYVNTTGWWNESGTFNLNDTQPIQAAIDAATDGDTIYVYNGSYSENVNVNQRVTLQGEGASVVNVSAANPNKHVFKVTVDYVNISGFNVTGATNGKGGICLSNATFANISDNNASNNFGGILLSNSSNNTIYNNNASFNSNLGIGLDNSSDNNLTGNTANNNEYGIVVIESDYNMFTNPIVLNNIDGFTLNGSSHNIITATEVPDNSGWEFYTQSNSINNTFVISSAISFTGKDFGIKPATSPDSDPVGYQYLGGYINATNTSADSWLFINRSYSEEDMNGLNESSTGWWRYNATASAWEMVAGENGVDTTENYVYANITSFSIFAAFAEIRPLLYVGDGQPYDTIQAAINAALPGETIIVNSGTYYENVVVNKTLTLRGNDSGEGLPVVDAMQADHAINITADGVTLDGFIATNATYTDIEQIGILVISDNNVIVNNNASSNFAGIVLFNSSNNNMTDNTASSNDYGIVLFNSSNNNMTGNDASLNNEIGIFLDSSDSNNLTGNNANFNSHGIYLISSNDNTITDNDVNDNNAQGIVLNSSISNTLEDNRVNSNNYNGILLEFSSHNNNISGNIVNENGDRGILLDNSSNNNVTYNNASYNGGGILLVTGSQNNLIANNNASNNSNFGIDLSHTTTDNNQIYYNTANGNDINGINLNFSNDNTIIGNTVNQNGENGIRLDHSSDNNLTGNTANNNRLNGILLEDDSNYNTLIDNTEVSNTFWGLKLSSSHYNSITDNNASSNNADAGIQLVESDYNTLINTIAINNADGIKLEAASHNIFTNFVLGNIGWEVILHSNSINNTFTDPAVTFTGKDFSINDTDSPDSNPEGYSVIGLGYLNAINNSADSWLFINGSHSDEEVYGLNESSARLWRYNATAPEWELVPGTNGVNVDENYVYANITSSTGFGIFAAFAEIRPPLYVTDYGSIQAAINAASDGDTVIVNSSTYYENVIVNKTGLILRGNENGTGLLPVVDAKQAGDAITLSNDSITLEGFNVTNSSNYGIYVTSDNNKILNNNANNNNYGIYLYDSSNNTVYNNTAESNSYTGIYLISGSNNNRIDSNTVRLNILYDLSGIHIENSNENTVINNNASDNDYGIFLLSSSNNNISNNIANNNLIHGIWLNSLSNNNTIYNNTANNNNYYGIYLYDSSNNNTLTDNTVKSNTEWDFYSRSDSIDNTVTNLDIGSVISFTGKDIAIKSAPAPESDPSGYYNLNKYINATNNSADSWLFLNISYSDSDISGLNENSLRMWEYDGVWSQVSTENGVNAAQNYVYANITSFSIFAPMGQAVTVEDTSRTGGRGGGGAGSDEPWGNINFSVFIRIQMTEGKQTSCNFDKGPVKSIGVMPLVTYGGLVTCKVEVLNGPSDSTEGTELPDGFVFRHLNIYLGNSGWSEGRISNPVINLVIPAGWFEDNDIDPSSVTMYRYNDGEWQPLETTLTGQEGGNYQYSVQASGFSPFVIIGQPTSGATTGVSGTDTSAGDEAVADKTETAPDATKKGIPGFGILLGAMGILIAVYARKK